MSGLERNRIAISRVVAGTALALTMVTAVSAAAAPIEDAKAIEALIPVPETIDVPPPTIADIGPLPAGTTVPGRPTAAVAPTKDPGEPRPPGVTGAIGPGPSGPGPIASKTPPADGAAGPVETPPATSPEADKAKAAALPPADVPVAEKLRELITTKIEKFLSRKQDRQPIEAFYAARSFAPLWIQDGAASDRAKAVIARLQQADTEGLDPSDYHTPDIVTGSLPDALADAEIKLTVAAINYARHAQTGRVHYSRVSGDIFYNEVVPEPADILGKLAGAKDAGDALGSYNPPHAAYQALKAKLAEVRGRAGDAGPARIGTGPVLKIGVQDARVPLLRERLGLSGDADNLTYDKALAEAIKKFQRQHDLSPSGSLTTATVEALNGPRHDHDADIIVANMERWRWLPRDLGKAYVMVNIPDYTLKVVDNGAVAWRTKIVVGKPSMPTPLLSETMKFITVNPTWNVPPSIIQNEYLPALQQDPTALERIGLQVEYERDGTVRIFQPPGDRNALGRIRFNFPNKFLVYQHDTPDKYLFAHDKRAYSHGCMRVENPLKYGEVLLSITAPNQGWTAERLHRMFGSAEQNIDFPTPIPVHLTYQTASVDESGKLVIREDIYGRDARLLAILKGDERRVADIAIERPSTSSRNQAVRVQPPRQTVGFSFFERLFFAEPPPPRTAVFPRNRPVR